MITFQVDELDCFIDEIDTDLLNINWRLFSPKNGNTSYLIGRPVKRSDKGRPPRDYLEQSIHRVIMSRIVNRPLLPIEEVDHKDLNGLNNTRKNLRIATRVQNIANRSAQSNNQLGIKGVRETPNGKFVARIRVSGIRKHIGTFDTIEEAHTAYMTEAEKLYGEFTRG